MTRREQWDARWQYLKQLGPSPGRYLTYGRQTVVTKETMHARALQGRKPLAAHEVLAPWQRTE